MLLLHDPLLRDLWAFYLEHERSGELAGGVKRDCVWMTCTCGARQRRLKWDTAATFRYNPGCLERPGPVAHDVSGMPLDHYVSQVHLRQFYSPALGNRLHALRKANLKTFTPNSEAVCGIHDGSTNAYLRENRAIEAFLETIEPNYNDALDKLSAGRIDHACIYTIAGFVAYVATCSPAGMRIGSAPLKNMVEETTARMDAKGDLPPAPAALGRKTMTELIREGTIAVEIDRKYPQAIGTAQILALVATFGNFKWEILRNDFDDRPFFTSDFPRKRQWFRHS